MWSEETVDLAPQVPGAVRFWAVPGDLAPRVSVDEADVVPAAPSKPNLE